MKRSFQNMKISLSKNYKITILDVVIYQNNHMEEVYKILMFKSINFPVIN